jgi:nucleotide-sensitive chloride channel 1A
LLTSTRRLIWLSEAEKGKGYAVDFLAISLHAASRDLEAYPSPCLYTQVIGQASSPFADTLVLVVELLPLEVQ